MNHSIIVPWLLLPHQSENDEIGMYSYGRKVLYDFEAFSKQKFKHLDLLKSWMEFHVMRLILKGIGVISKLAIFCVSHIGDPDP